MLNKKIRGESVCHLKRILTKKRNKPLPKNDIEEIQELIKIKKANIENMWEAFIDSDLYKLGAIKTIKDRKDKNAKTRILETYLAGIEILNRCTKNEISLSKYQDKIKEEYTTSDYMKGIK